MKSDANTLGMVGDGDELYLIRRIEGAFAVKFGDGELRRFLTVGDLFDVLSRRLGATHKRRSVCLSAVAFYRLRRALVQCGSSKRAAIATDLNAMLGRKGLGQKWADVTAAASLKLPPLELTDGSSRLQQIVMTAGAAMSLWYWSFWPIALAITCSVLLGTILPRQNPKPYSTLGGLTEHVRTFNFGAISREYGVVHPTDVWNSLQVVLREECGTGYKGEINRETRFF